MALEKEINVLSVIHVSIEKRIVVFLCYKRFPPEHLLILAAVLEVILWNYNEKLFFFVCPFCLIIIFVRTLRVIKADFFDLDVGSVRRVILMPSRKVQAQDRGWTLKKVLRSPFL